MLSSQEASRAAALLSSRFGEVAIAAMLRSREGGARGERVEMINSRRIAEHALGRA